MNLTPYSITNITFKYISNITYNNCCLLITIFLTGEFKKFVIASLPTFIFVCVSYIDMKCFVIIAPYPSMTFYNFTFCIKTPKISSFYNLPIVYLYDRKQHNGAQINDQFYWNVMFLLKDYTEDAKGHISEIVRRICLRVSCDLYLILLHLFSYFK